MIFIVCILVFIFICLINLIVIGKSSKYINSNINYDDYDYIIVLGAKVNRNSPSLMLKDRLDKAVEIYNKNKNIKIIVSGDSQNPILYDEISVMSNYLINNGISKNNIIEDKYGISTYDSIYRIKDRVMDKKIIIVTQKYHLFRSVYIARGLDINSVGISAREYNYPMQFQRDIREISARVKDFILVKFKFKSKNKNKFNLIKSDYYGKYK